MDERTDVPQERIDALYGQLDQDAEAGGYHLNSDEAFARDLVSGLLINQQRYGYQSCPCRLAVGDREKDLDIICPCDYRDADLLDWGACYCALYVSDEVLRGQRELEPVPERRPAQESARPQYQRSPAPEPGGERRAEQSALPVWRCRVCGYLCARDRPPEKCPICKAAQDRFERFW
jgi:ferredoxin-thioredoxin reductase catalytic chain